MGSEGNMAFKRDMCDIIQLTFMIDMIWDLYTSMQRLARLESAHGDNHHYSADRPEGRETVVYTF